MAAHSEGGQTWSTKLARIGELSANDGLIVFNNLGHIIDKASDRFAAKLKGMRSYLKENLAEKTDVVLKKVIAMVRGWMNYHSISDNEPRVGAFVLASKQILLWWINRKGGRRKMNWDSYNSY